MTFHLHIKGRVQGVGFRPHVYKCAVCKHISGYVSNEADGVHVVSNHTSQQEANAFATAIIQGAPKKAIIQCWHLEEIEEQHFKSFTIRVQDSDAQPNLLLSPDFAMCPQCRQEFNDPANRRYHYPFITCTLCGPRYSILKHLPYERHLTIMDKFTQCPLCQKEYNDVNDRRYFSQTNSCANCGVQLTWHTKNNKAVLTEPAQILNELLNALQKGDIVAVKGIGGFLLLCDAANSQSIQTLRKRKHRPQKPFAVLFPDIHVAGDYTELNELAENALLGEVSPIILLKASELCFKELDMQGIAPNLSSIGVMLPYAPLLEWIISAFKHPLIATSGNISGSGIVFQSERKETLFEYADFILDHNRAIIIPQDDSVVRFAEKNNQQVIIRRSRGLAPAIIPSSTNTTNETIFAAGAMLKSAFAIQHNQQVYLSQFLGNLESYDSQQNYLHTFNHFRQLVNAQPQVVLADLHPDYPSTQIAAEHAIEWNVPLLKIQHHEAHFAALLGEYGLFNSKEKVLGVIWDGTGLGSDGNIWGGEFFIYENGKMERVHYLEPFINIAGDKMAKEPRLAALAISHNIEEAVSIIRTSFTNQEWNYYQKALLQPHLFNSSAGRYFDAVAALLHLADINSYEGEAALLLEQKANDYVSKKSIDIANHYFDEEINGAVIPMKHLIQNIINDINAGKSEAEIAALFHVSLAVIVQKVAYKYSVKKIACSGGVFQNTVLIDLLYLVSEKHFDLFFHRQLPPNDECIAFGQLMHYQNIKI